MSGTPSVLSTLRQSRKKIVFKGLIFSLFIVFLTECTMWVPASIASLLGGRRTVKNRVLLPLDWDVLEGWEERVSVGRKFRVCIQRTVPWQRLAKGAVKYIKWSVTHRECDTHTHSLPHYSLPVFVCTWVCESGMYVCVYMWAWEREVCVCSVCLWWVLRVGTGCLRSFQGRRYQLWEASAAWKEWLMSLIWCLWGQQC